MSAFYYSSQFSQDGIKDVKQAIASHIIIVNQVNEIIRVVNGVDYFTRLGVFSINASPLMFPKSVRLVLQDKEARFQSSQKRRPGIELPTSSVQGSIKVSHVQTALLMADSSKLPDTIILTMEKLPLLPYRWYYSPFPFSRRIRPPRCLTNTLYWDK